jgi:hypothetical protein
MSWWSLVLQLEKPQQLLSRSASSLLEFYLIRQLLFRWVICFLVFDFSLFFVLFSAYKKAISLVIV